LAKEDGATTGVFISSHAILRTGATIVVAGIASLFVSYHIFGAFDGGRLWGYPDEYTFAIDPFTHFIVMFGCWIITALLIYVGVTYLIMSKSVSAKDYGPGDRKVVSVVGMRGGARGQTYVAILNEDAECPACGASIGEVRKFCPECGRSLAQSQSLTRE
jgi:hypothetical protein